MKLPEAIALMLEGKVVTDSFGDMYRGEFYGTSMSVHALIDGVWMPDPLMPINGWREATPEELKEIGA